MIYRYEDESPLNLAVHKLFEVIISIEKYPEFIPWCAAVNIVRKSHCKIIADVIASFKGIKGKYTCEVTFNLPSIQQNCLIEVRAVQGLFKYLHNVWELTPQDENRTIVKFFIEFEFKSPLFQKMFGIAYKHAQKKIISAFKKRIYLLT
ncbi:MAG: ubiquinone-binding protein [Candidatus Mesenet longicola]|uniref:Ubiquinone-binding protein n=1 Tax=Candidatus Mesenet longicola TaxID=1892558 RepID=A0A8J3MN19_9RICK|nr:MAG: ubiquinone-binding protein [Candidatus Mesenet longicola]GHM59747.1 MAG: ubiquinone-binding protein [Candidatus Mesenet longicola]